MAIRPEDLTNFAMGMETLREAADKAGVSVQHMASAMAAFRTMDARKFRQEYECQFDDPVDVTSWGDTTRQFVPRRADPKIMVEFYGYPITITRDNFTDEFRIEAWMPDQQGRTQPLLAQKFTHDAFHEQAVEYRSKMQHDYGYNPSSYEEMFCVEWAKQNMRDIERNYHRRENTGTASFTDRGVTESTEEQKRRALKLEEARLAREAAEAKKQDALEAIPNWGAF
jgi:hypothetical protein